MNDPQKTPVPSTTEWKSALAGVFTEVMEDLAFAFAEAGPTMADTRQSFIHVMMRFSGPLRGKVRMAVPESLCRELSANILGMEADHAESVRLSHDALREILNTICGRFLRELPNNKEGFDLTPPVTGRMRLEEVRAFAGSKDAASFLVDDSPVFVGAVFDE